MKEKTGTPKPTRRQALLGSLAVPLQPTAAIPADGGAMQAKELVGALDEYAMLCKEEGSAQRTLESAMESLEPKNFPDSNEMLPEHEISELAELLRSQSRTLRNFLPKRQALKQRILKLMDGKAQPYPTGKSSFPLAHLGDKDGILTPDSFTHGMTEQEGYSRELLSQFSAKESAILARCELDHKTYQAMEAACMRIAPEMNERQISQSVRNMLDEVPPGAHWSEHFAKRANIDTAVGKLEEKRQHKKQDEQEREKRVKESDARNTRLGIIYALQDFFKLKFSYSRGEFRAEAPLHGNEEIRRFHAAIERIVTLTNTEEETLKVPPCGYFFVQDRIENLEGKKCRTPPMLAVPRLQEFRLNEKIAQRLADVIDRLQEFPEGPSHREHNEDPIACYREHQQRMTEYYGGIADSLETLRDVGYGIWVNRIQQWGGRKAVAEKQKAEIAR